MAFDYLIDYVIVGAGFAGAVCAERLASVGKRVLVIDQRAHIGGNAYDEYDDAGILVHRYGAHCFHTNSQEVWDYLSRFTEWRPYEHRVLSSVDGKLLAVPINLTTLEAFGGDELAARNAMIEPYTRKQWGEYADRLSPTVLARVKTRDNRDDRYFADMHQAMPLYGYTRLFKRMLAHPNIHVLLKTRYDELPASWAPKWRWRGNELQYQATIETVYSGPVDEFFHYRLGRLPYCSADFKFETYDREQFQPVGVINYPAEAIPWTRVLEFKHLTGQKHHQTTVAYEYPQAEGEPYWPVPTAASAALYKQYEALTRQISGVHFVGRLGTYRYLDMWAVVAQALKLSKQLIAKEVPCPT